MVSVAATATQGVMTREGEENVIAKPSSEPIYLDPLTNLRGLLRELETASHKMGQGGDPKQRDALIEAVGTLEALLTEKVRPILGTCTREKAFFLRK